MLTFWPVILSKRFVPVSLVVMRNSREKRSIFRCSCPIQLNCYMKRAVQLQEQIQGNSGKALRSSFYLTRFGKDGRVKFAIRSAHSRRQASGSRAYGPVYGSRFRVHVDRAARGHYHHRYPRVNVDRAIDGRQGRCPVEAMTWAVNRHYNPWPGDCQ